MIHERIDLGDCSEREAGGDGFVPRLETYVLGGERARGAVVVCPGGGYEYRSAREAEPIALRFNAAGLHAFVLQYSVAPRRHPRPLMDAACALMAVRARAAEWRLDPGRVAICGFSAGGHLAASLGTLWDSPEVAGSGILRGAPAEACRPDALVLCYPVISSGEFAHRGSFEALLGPEAPPALLERLSLERRVGEGTPPTFIWHTFDDASVPAENSLLFAAALRRAGVPFELHVYPSGKHGLSLATKETDDDGRGNVPHAASWMGLCVDWLEGLWPGP